MRHTASRMFYNYYFSLSFLCLAHFLLCSASSSCPPACPSLTLLSHSPLSLAFVFIFSLSLFAPRFTLHLTFGLALPRANSFRYCFSPALLLLRLRLLLLLLFLYYLLSWHSSFARYTNSPHHSQAPPVRRNSPRLASSGIWPYRKLRLLRRGFFVHCFTCLESRSLCLSLAPFFFVLSSSLVCYFAVH